MISKGSSLIFQKSQDLIKKNPKIEQKKTAKLLKIQENGEDENIFTYIIYPHGTGSKLQWMDDVVY